MNIPVTTVIFITIDHKGIADYQVQNMPILKPDIEKLSLHLSLLSQQMLDNPGSTIH